MSILGGLEGGSPGAEARHPRLHQKQRRESERVGMHTGHPGNVRAQADRCGYKAIKYGGNVKLAWTFMIRVYFPPSRGVWGFYQVLLQAMQHELWGGELLLGHAPPPTSLQGLYLGSGRK